MARCMKCGDPFNVEDAKFEFRQHLMFIGYSDSLLESEFNDWFDEDLCHHCNIDHYNSQNDVSYSGDYRSREDYESSGGPVDPCDDALWLHDQE